jgi:hypothetical protein
VICGEGNGGIEFVVVGFLVIGIAKRKWKLQVWIVIVNYGI